MPITKEYFVFPLPGGDRQIKLPKYYGDVNTQLGITKAATSDGQPNNTPTGDAERLYRDGLLIKIRVSVKNGTKYRRTTLYCPLTQASSALGALEGKSFGTELKGGKLNIVNAYLATRRKFRY